MARQVAAFVKRDKELEVQGGEEGFFGSWYLARVTGVNEATGVITLRYAELLKDDGTAETETLPDAGRLRPPLGRWLAAGGAKRPQALAQYRAGDAVEVLYEEGWWEGYIATTYDTHVTLRFDSNPGEEMEINDPLRLRPGYFFDGVNFGPLGRRTGPGVRDERTTAAPRSGGVAPKSRVSHGGRTSEGPGSQRGFNAAQQQLPPFASAGALYPPPSADSSGSSDDDVSGSEGGADRRRSGIAAAEAAGQRALRAAAKAAAAAPGGDEEPNSKRRRVEITAGGGWPDDVSEEVHRSPPLPMRSCLDLLQPPDWAPCAAVPVAPPPAPPADVAAAVVAACVRRSVVLSWRTDAQAVSDGADTAFSAADAAFAALRRRLRGLLVRVHPPAQSAEYRLLHVTDVGLHNRPYDCPPKQPGPAGTETIGLWLAGGPGTNSFRRLYRLVDISDAPGPTPQEVAVYCATHFKPGQPVDLGRLHLLAASAAEPLLAPP